jgi:exodeoxyribonuclease VII small subunit
MSETFEDATRRLSQIVEELEAGDLPLERSLALFEEGVKLARGAQERLDRAERRVEELLGLDENGRPLTRDFEGAGPSSVARRDPGSSRRDEGDRERRAGSPVEEEDYEFGAPTHVG